MNSYYVEKKCPNCKSDEDIANWEDGTKECRSCGLLLSQNLFVEEEEFEDDDEYMQERAGSSLRNLREKKATDTEENRSRGDEATASEPDTPSQSKLAPNVSPTAAKVIRVQKPLTNKVSSHAERLTATAMVEIDELSSRLELAKAILERAKKIYKEYRKYLTQSADESDSNKRIRRQRVSAKRSKEIAASSVFLACRLLRDPRTFAEMSGATDIPKKNLGRLVNRMEQIIMWERGSRLTIMEDLISRWCNEMNLSQDIAWAAKVLAKTVRDKEGVHGKPGCTIAAAAIFSITRLSEHGHKTSATQVGEATGVSAGTIQKVCRLISPYIADSLPKDFKQIEPAAAGPPCQIQDERSPDAQNTPHPRSPLASADMRTSEMGPKL